MFAAIITISTLIYLFQAVIIILTFLVDNPLEITDVKMLYKFLIPFYGIHLAFQRKLELE